MKGFIKKILFIVKIIYFLPLLLPYWLTPEKEKIISDLDKWTEVLGWQKRADKIQLLALLQEAKEFRNLYYFRLFKGNYAGRVLMYLLKNFYQPCPDFFLDNSCNIGSGLFIQHGFSTIIMADIGNNCWINQQVTIGHKDKTGRPQIGDNVRITAGAKVIGNIKIGNNVTVGANAVVVKDVPDHCVVVGVPAYIVKKNGIAVREKL
jgi:serine O-acetyltransferase